MATEIALTHHGAATGRPPARLRGQEIPIVGRITAVADAFDAMTHARPYKRAFSVPHAIAEIKRCSGTQFDPRIVDAFMTLDHFELVGGPRGPRSSHGKPELLGSIVPRPRPAELAEAPAPERLGSAPMSAQEETGVRCGASFSTYPEVFGRALRVAGGLNALGVGAGDRVALLLRNSIEFLEASIATAPFGASAVPINWHWRGDEIAHVLGDSGAKALIAHAGLWPAIGPSVAAGLA